MRRGKNKNRIAIIGHTKGIGKAIAKLYKKKGFEVVGLSRSNGYDLETKQEDIIKKLLDCHLIVVNAYAGRGQFELLKRIPKEPRMTHAVKTKIESPL